MTATPAHDTGARRREAAIEPALPIVDAHHHLWDRTPYLPYLDNPAFGWQHVMVRTPVYLAQDCEADLAAGHAIVATVHVECGSFYDAAAPIELQPVGESAAVAKIAEDFAVRRPNGPRMCAAIVGHADLARGDAAAAVLEAHVAAGNGRMRGIRQSNAYDPDPMVLGPINAPDPALYRSDAFRAGFARLAPLGLAFDAYMLEPQLPELIDLARNFPDTAIVLDHLGTPLGVEGYAGRLGERFPIWKANLSALAELPNVTVKLGGLGMELSGSSSFLADVPATSETLAREWRPYIEAAVELFGPDRCMFESNYPADSGTADYATIWNAFKRIAAAASPTEKTALFSGTAARVYRI